MTRIKIVTVVYKRSNTTNLSTLANPRWLHWHQDLRFTAESEKLTSSCGKFVFNSVMSIFIGKQHALNEERQNTNHGFCYAV